MLWDPQIKGTKGIILSQKTSPPTHSVGRGTQKCFNNEKYPFASGRGSIQLRSPLAPALVTNGLQISVSADMLPELLLRDADSPPKTRLPLPTELEFSGLADRGHGIKGSPLPVQKTLDYIQ